MLQFPLFLGYCSPKKKVVVAQDILFLLVVVLERLSAASESPRPRGKSFQMNQSVMNQQRA